MRRKSYFKDINFNKDWAEEDWEKFFQLQDHYITQKLNPTNILRLRTANGRFALVKLEKALSELGLAADIPIVKEFQKRAERESSNTEAPNPLDNPVYFSKEGASLQDLPIYTQAYGYAAQISRVLDKLTSRRKARPVARGHLNGEPEALKLHASWTVINLALGHKIGYDPDCIRGNIAKCKRALKHADSCVGLVGVLSRWSKSQKIRRVLFAESVRLRNRISNWIDELRSKFDGRAHSQ